MTQNICFLDLEATGFDKKKDSIIEIALLIRNPEKRIIQQFESVFKPDKSQLTDFIAQLTGIDQTEIDTKGKNLDDYKSQLKELIGDSIIVGHNIDFDIEYLTANGIDVSKNKRIDTHELARILLVNEESYALEVLAHKYGFKQSSAHRAMSDVEVNVEIYDWLVDKINHLPSKLIDQIKPILQTKTDWYAKHLFMNRDSLTQKKEALLVRSSSLKNDTTALKQPKKLPLNFSQHIFIEAGNNIDNAAWQKQLATQHSPSLIITDKIDHFSGFKVVPTANVIFAPERLKKFLEKRTHLNNQEITFYLQCSVRHYLEYRGKKFFDLFFKQRDLWHEVCLRESQDNEKDIWEKIINERSNESVLIISPYAYFCLKDHPVIKNRMLIIDEIEAFAEKLLFSVTDEYSIRSYLENESTTIAAQFWVRNICRDVLEPILQKSLPPFPSKVLLPNNAQYPDLADAWDQFTDTEDQKASTHLRTPLEGIVRWINYYPSTGNVRIGIWSSHKWKEARNNLQNKKIIGFIRSPRSDNSLDFVRYFLGIQDPTWRKLDELKPKYKITIPDDLISVKSPDFNIFTAEKIRSYANQLEYNDRLIANFTSQESLQKVYTNLKLGEKIGNNTYAVLGERASGGSGKVAYLAQNHDNKILCTQRTELASFSQRPYTQFILQRFPFAPPHPLLSRIEELMKQKGKNFWDIWTMIHTSANISRRVSVFPHLKEVIILDGRHNTRWGKKLLINALN